MKPGGQGNKKEVTVSIQRVSIYVQVEDYYLQLPLQYQEGLCPVLCNQTCCMT